MRPFAPDLSEARRLLGAGMTLVELVPWTKQPIGEDWNHRPAQSINPEATGYGLILASNKLCSLDPDNVAKARGGMKALGFDLDKLMDAGVRTRSTRKGSGGRSTFAWEGDLSWLTFRSKATGTVIEFRAESPNLQDCIPGVVYMDKGGDYCRQEYANGKRLDEAPPLPDELFRWWERCSQDVEFLRDQERRFFAAIGTDPLLSISTGKGGSLAYAAPRYRTAYNAANSVEDVLERHAYTWHRDLERWAPPTATGAPGVRPIPGRDGLWRSDHASDPLHGTFDAWTAHVVLDHAGDLEAAKRAAKAEGLVRDDTPPPVELTPVEAYEDEGDSVPERIPERCARPASPLFWPSDALAYLPPPARVKGLLPRQGRALIRGASNTGKTAFAIDLAAAVARGIAWRDRKTERGAVLYVAAENPGSVKGRVKAYVTEHPEAERMALAVLCEPVNLLSHSSVDNLIARAREAEAATGEHIAAVFLDTLSACLSGQNENAPEVMTAAMDAALRIAEELQTLVVIVHHTGKDETRGARGHTSLIAAVDTEIAVTGNMGTRSAEVTKQRDLPTGDVFEFTVTPVTIGRDPDTGDNITGIVATHSASPAGRRRPTGKAQTAILNAMEAGERGKVWSRDELRVAANGAGIKHRNTIRDAIDRLTETGFLVASVGGHRLA